ncbi:MAG: GntR family transcriptional regulator [bacterium]|nr:GntR family transcriptional regulator [bacterium]
MSYSTPMIPFVVKWEAGVPVYEQVIYAVKKAIASNRLAEGDKFPSVRVLSKELHINPNTAQKIVSKLVQEKILEMHPGIGSVVAPKIKADRQQRKLLLDKKVERIVVEAKGLSLTEDDLIRAIRSHWKKFSEVKK